MALNHSNVKEILIRPHDPIMRQWGVASKACTKVTKKVCAEVTSHTYAEVARPAWHELTNQTFAKLVI